MSWKLEKIYNHDGNFAHLVNKETNQSMLIHLEEEVRITSSFNLVVRPKSEKSLQISCESEKSEYFGTTTGRFSSSDGPNIASPPRAEAKDET